MDEALTGITEAISINPEEFDLIPGKKRLRIAKTRHFDWNEGVIPHLHIWFVIKDENTVQLLAIDRESEEDYGE